MNQTLLQELILSISGNKSRIKCLSGMIMSLITGSSIHLKGLSLGIEGATKTSSKIHRIYRFFREFTFDYIQVTHLILHLFNQDNYIMALDRTNWKFGKTDINILFLVIVIGNISVPIYWKSLPHRGACSAEFMEEFMQKFITNFGTEKIRYLLADREFMNKNWLNFLINKNINFVIPLKSDTKVRLEKSLKTLSIKKTFNDIKALEHKGYEGYLWGRKVHLAACRNDKSELMVLVAPEKVEVNAFALYKYRWSIERLFKHLKSGGFDIERSHLSYMDRFEKLLVVASIAAGLIVKNGVIQSAENPIRIKRYQDKQKQLFSIFTYGFDHIKAAFYKSKDILMKLLSSLLLPLNKPLPHPLCSFIQKKM